MVEYLLYLQQNTYMTSYIINATFIGYTEFAQKQSESLHLKMQLIHSLDEFESFFGGSAPAVITAQLSADNQLESYSISKNFLLYDSVKLFFLKGGNGCYIVSVGGYEQRISAGDDTQGLRAGLAVLQSGPSAQLLLMPDAVTISETTHPTMSFQGLQQSILACCAMQENRFALLDQQQTLQNLKYQQACDSKLILERVETPNFKYAAVYSPWVKTRFSSAIKLRHLKLGRAGFPISFHSLVTSVDGGEQLDELEQAIDNNQRIVKSIKRRLRGSTSLTGRFHILLANYLSQSIGYEENSPLRTLLQFLKGLAEMINNWICACTLDEVLSGGMIDIIRQTIIPEMANEGLPRLIQLHQQAINLKMVASPTTGYKEMFCLTSCIGSNCPWQQTDESQILHLSDNPAKNEGILRDIFNYFDDAIEVVSELSKQFEEDAQEHLLQQCPPLNELFSTLQQSRYIPPSAVAASIMCIQESINFPVQLELNAHPNISGYNMSYIDE